MKEVKQIGKIRYIEPNEIKGNNVSIPEKYEDYTMYVDLRIDLPSRYGYKGESVQGRYSTLDGTLTFMGGTNGSLTTNYTDIDLSMNPESNTRECLGIESINISYDQNMVPIINVKFIDVRGGSFFSPQEYRYFEAGGDSADIPTNLPMSNFMSAIYSIPSPIFTFVVKGYYGQPVEFQMDRNTVDAKFNSETGNFEVEASFLGYMYSIYPDLPMTYVLLAPYMKEISGYGGASHWEKKFRSRYNIMTFHEFKSKISGLESAKELDAENNELTKKVKELTEQKNRLKVTISAYSDIWQSQNEGVKIFSIPKYLSLKTESGDSFNYNIVIASDDKEQILSFFKEEKKKVIENTYSLINSWRVKVPKIFNVIENSKDYTMFDDNGDINFSKLADVEISENDKKLSIHGIGLSDYIGNGTNTDLVEKIIEFIEKSAKDYTKTEGKSKFCVMFIDDGLFLSSSGQEIKNKEDEIASIREKIETGNTDMMRSLIGFRPSIRNYFKMVFAHIDTFIYVFYRCLGSIKEDTGRNIGKFNIGNLGNDIKCDVSDDILIDSNNKMPPFPVFFRSKKESNNVIRNEYLKPGEEFFTSDNFAELRLVNSIYDAIESYEEISKDAYEKGKDNRINRGWSGTIDREFIPLTAYDILNYTNRDYSNPWEELKKEMEGKTKEEFAPYIAYMLFLRYGSYTNYRAEPVPENGASTNPETRGEEYFSKMEAVNFYKANKKVNDEFISFIKEINEEGVVKYSKNLVKDMTNNFPFKDDDFKYNFSTGGKFFIKKGNKRYFPLWLDGINFLGRVTEEEIMKDDCKWYRLDEENPGCLCNIFDEDIFCRINECYDQQIRALSENGLSADYFGKIKIFSSYYSVIKNTLFDKDNSETIMKSKAEDTAKSLEAIGRILFKTDKVKKDIYKILRTKGALDSIDKITPCVISKIRIDNGNLFLWENLTLAFDNIYTSNEDIYAKAYLFLMSIPVKYIGSDTDKSESKNMLEFLIDCAALWRYSIMNTPGASDPVNFSGTIVLPKDCLPKKGNKDNLVQGIYLNTNNKASFYQKINVPYSGVIEKCASFFKEWAENVFRNDVATVLEDERSYVSFENASISDSLSYICKLAGWKGLDKSKIKGVKFLSEAPVSFRDSIYNLLFGNVTFVRVFNKDSATSIKGFQNTALKNFLETLTRLYANDIYTNGEDKSIMDNYDASEDLKDDDYKLSIYLSLKKLYERHFASDKESRWTMSDDGLSDREISRNPTEYNGDCDFDNFYFLDTYYNDIGDDLLLDTNYISSLLDGIISAEKEGEENEDDDPMTSSIGNYSVEKFLSVISERSGVLLKAFPLGNAILSDYNNGGFSKDGGAPFNVEEMFSAKAGFSPIRAGNCFMAIYNDKPSECLSINGTEFSNDSFGIVNSDGTMSDDIPPSFADNELNNFSIPAFGVTYGKQNQSYFSDINIHMDTFKDTEASIDARIHIAKKGSEGPAATNLYGQNIYNIYSGYGFMIDVESVGNMQIMPGMLFQLNNIPMFYGTYMIYKVSHSISPGSFVTTFTGGRMKRYGVPFKQEYITIQKNKDMNEHSEEEMGFTRKNDGFVENLDVSNMVVVVDKKILDQVELDITDETLRQTNYKDKTGNMPQTEEEKANLKELKETVIIPIMKSWKLYCEEKGWKNDLRITSCFRNEEVNNAANGSSTSAHRWGCAVDFQTIKNPDDFLKFVIRYMEDSKTPFDQILNEKRNNRVLHIGTKRRISEGVYAEPRYEKANGYRSSDGKWKTPDIYVKY